MPRAYHRDYSRNYYHKKRAEYKALLGGKCVKCGSDADLHFDHVDPTTREFRIGRLLSFSKAKALLELKKCQLLCHPCHKLKTYEQWTVNGVRRDVDRNRT